MRTTIKGRRKLWAELSRKFNQWNAMSDAELLATAILEFPALTAATRGECLKVLVMSHTEKMI